MIAKRHHSGRRVTRKIHIIRSISAKGGSFAAWGAHRWPAEEWRHAQRQGRMHRHHWPRLRQRQCPSLAVFRPIRQIPTPISKWIALLISEH